MDQNLILSGLVDLLRIDYLDNFIIFLHEYCYLDRKLVDLIKTSIESNSFSKLEDQFSENTDWNELNIFELLVQWIFYEGIMDAVKILITNNYDMDYMNHYAIITCARKGYLDIMKLLFRQNADIHIHNEMPLRISAQRNDFSMVQFILDNGADINKVKNDSFTLETIINQENFKMLKLLYATKNDPTVIQYAIEIDNAELMNFIIANIPNIDYNKLFLKTIKKNSLDCFLSLVGKVNSKTKNKAFVMSCELGHENIVRILLRYKVSIHFDNETPLKIAIKNGHLGIVKILVNTDIKSKICLENSANIHVNDDEPLALACDHNYPDIIKYLIKNGANIYSRDFYVLKSCINKKYFEIVDLLISKYKI